MRALLCLCLASGLFAGDAPRPEAPEPGKDSAFLSRIMGDSHGGTRPWHTFTPPAESASAVVEVVGELTQEELRQVAFQEFIAWFRQDLRRFLRTIGGDLPESASLASATQPVDRFGGNPVPRNVPLGRVNF
ncbi:hypothetical protein [Geothrix fuzhouensis]|uniref:hypothetical protein n=1 Tax=Geothrix fuzhouensis TaxID=2966451 RepID=UPI002148A98B|nr:hypothetical protein [Geothrix fuzhouensis]